MMEAARDDVLAEIAFEPIDGHGPPRSGATKRAKTQRPRNYALFALRIPVGAQESIGGLSMQISTKPGLSRCS